MNAPPDGRRFRCGAAARVLPFALALASLAAGWALSFRFEAVGLAFAGGLTLRQLVTLLGGVVGWWLLRQGAELRQTFALLDGGVAWEYGARRRELAWSDVDRIAYDPPFVGGKRWIPALVFEDVDGGRHRVPAMLTDGAAFVDRIRDVTGRDDLAAWVDARGLRSRMGRAALRIRLGYGLALVGVLAAALVGAAG